jgi:DNA-binding helix-hairpin-helix protein with protein kinase domain
MKLLQDETGQAWRLESRMGGGGEGEVFRVAGRPDLCAKVYFQQPVSGSKVEKLRALHRLQPLLHGVAALPLGLLSEPRKSRGPVGVLMPYVGGHDIHQIYSPVARQKTVPGASLPLLIATAKNVAFIFGKLHGHGIVVGDVSEQNIRVLPDATARLIDCDSVQLDTGTAFHECGVGSLLWTPPELQSGPLPRRTANHDRFGLAQLIFLLLFGGRYPFSGTPEPGVLLDPGEAIARHAFAYDPQPAVRLLRAPNSALPFASYPGSIQTLFLRAFRRGSELPEARPAPGEWIEALENLQQQLARCSEAETHWHWSGLTSCPWCALAHRTGMDVFPSTRQPAKPCPPQMPATLWGPETFRIPVTTLQPPPAALVQQALMAPTLVHPRVHAVLGKYAVLRSLLEFWTSISAQSELGTNKSEIRALEKQVKRIQQQFSKKLQALEAAAEAAYSGPPRIQDLATEAEEEVCQQALQTFLEGHRLDDAVIRGLGQKRRGTLEDHGILTAADLEPDRLEDVPFLGPGMIGRLLAHRAALEQGYRPRQDPGITQRVEARLLALVQERLLEAKARIYPLLAEADDLRKEYAARVNKAQAAYEKLSVRQTVLRALV